jgi:hypothetical protein
MKRLLLSAFLGVICFAAKANNKVSINNGLCPGLIVTVQFVQYEIGPCTNNGTSPVYTPTPGQIYDLDDPNVWLPTTLQSYQTYSAIICVTCPGFPPVCLPPVGIGPNPTCDPAVAGPVAISCCSGSVTAKVSSGGGGCSYNLDILP